MSDKHTPVTFTLYRYLLSKAENTQMQLFDDIKSPEEAHAMRKKLMCDALEALQQSTAESRMRFWKEPTGIEGQYLFHVQHHTLKNIEQEFKHFAVKHQPSVWVAIDTDEQGQTIAVECSSQPRHKYVIQRLTTILQPYFQERGLVLQIFPISRKNKFWEFVNENRSEIRSVIFNISPPNMAGLTNDIAADMSALAATSGAKSAGIALTSRRGQPLELNENNPALNSLVSCIENGAGNCSFKFRSSPKLQTPDMIEHQVVAAPKETSTLVQRDIADPHTSILTKLRQVFRMNRKKP